MNSDIIMFFLTKKFLKSEKFKEEWSKRKNKIIIVVLLEEFDLNSTFGQFFNQFFVSNFYETLSLVSREESIQRNKAFLKKLINIKTINSNKAHDVILNKFSTNIYGNNIERVIVREIGIINDDEVILKISNRQNIEKIMIINWKMVKTIGVIGNSNIQKQEFCFVKHLNQIFCYQKEKTKLIKEAKCSLFSKTGNLIRTLSIHLIDNNIYDVISLFYNNKTLQFYLNIFIKYCMKRSIVTLDKEFNIINKINEDLFNPQFSLNFSSEIQFFDINYQIFHYNSNIAFLQLKNNNNVYTFDKLSYSIIDSFQTKSRLIMVFGNKMLFKSRNCYLIQEVPVSKKSENFFEYNAFCKLNPFKKPHLLSNPHVLPCGNSACLECIYQQYNLFKKSLTCLLCNQEHVLSKQLEPTNQSTINGFYDLKFINMIIDENKVFISNLGILNNIT
jgi:hypothetical protein